LKKKYLQCGELKVVHGGNEYFTMLTQLIESAQKIIHLHTYIFNDDKTGQGIAEALILAVKRGVKVYLLVDGYGSIGLSKAFIDRLNRSGVQFRFFEPIFKCSHFYFGRRLHHKIFVADDKWAIVSGLNIADRYNDLAEQKAWLDMGLMVNGQTAKELSLICNELWQKERKTLFSFRKKNYYTKIAGENKCLLRICRNDWIMGKHEIYKSYYNLFKNAKESIIVMCSYFLPGHSFRKVLKLAVKRGVHVKVVLAGTSDIFTVKQAERYLYRWMLRNKIEIYEYQPTVLHAKLGIADGELMIIGSYNVNDLSANASIELNIEVKSKEFAYPVNIEIEEIIQNDCIQIKPERIKIFSQEHFIQLICYYILRILLTVSTFYFKKEE
jgi:cardiolipin synthase A/B